MQAAWPATTTTDVEPMQTVTAVFQRMKSMPPGPLHPVDANHLVTVSVACDNCLASKTLSH